MSKITVVDLGNMNIKYIGDNEGMFSSKVATDYQRWISKNRIRWEINLYWYRGIIKGVQ
ncbi:MAG: hypothetical protein PHX70_08650 [Clostridium sp.]|nr:hypothetical protein [Clostridium sp.]